jgi:NAD(P)-dependent dehydrogenase (short-subunit alcohol dehydrogenase family)
MKLNLKNKVVLLTGAGKGIGRAILNLLIEEKVIIYAITRNKQDFKNIKKNKNLFLFVGDVTNQEIINQIFLRAKKNKHKFNCLVNNAGIRQRKKFSDINKQDLNVIFENNFFSLFNMSQHFSKQFKYNKTMGSIINISSIVGNLGFSELAGYASTKAAIDGLTKSLAAEFSKKKIRVNSIAPGFVKSSYFKKFKKEKSKLYKWTLSRIPLKKWGENLDIAYLTLFLISENSEYINGQVIKIDGGWTST